MKDPCMWKPYWVIKLFLVLLLKLTNLNSCKILQETWNIMLPYGFNKICCCLQLDPCFLGRLIYHWMIWQVSVNFSYTEKTWLSFKFLNPLSFQSLLSMISTQVFVSMIMDIRDNVILTRCMSLNLCTMSVYLDLYSDINDLDWFLSQTVATAHLGF